MIRIFKEFKTNKQIKIKLILIGHKNLTCKNRDKMW